MHACAFAGARARRANARSHARVACVTGVGRAGAAVCCGGSGTAMAELVRSAGAGAALERDAHLRSGLSALDVILVWYSVWVLANE